MNCVYSFKLQKVNLNLTFQIFSLGFIFMRDKVISALSGRQLVRD